jgi:hypothetical protein
MRLMYVILMLIVNASCSCKDEELSIVNTSIFGGLYVHEDEVLLRCNGPTVVGDTLIPLNCEIIIDKDTSFVRKVLSEVTSLQWKEMLNHETMAMSASLWLHMKTGRNGRHFFKLSNKNWSEFFYEAEHEFWIDLLDNDSIAINI